MSEGLDVSRQFNRAVDIVQSLPKIGRIQPSYDDKLAIYGLFKQATEGDRPENRPGLFDMLGRAKWDAWNKQCGITKQEAMSAYVQVLLKLLRKDPHDPISQAYIDELESFAAPLVPQESAINREGNQSSPNGSFMSSRTSLEQTYPVEPTNVPTTAHVPPPHMTSMGGDPVLDLGDSVQRRRSSDASSISLGGDAASHRASHYKQSVPPSLAAAGVAAGPSGTAGGGRGQISRGPPGGGWSDSPPAWTNNPRFTHIPRPPSDPYYQHHQTFPRHGGATGGGVHSLAATPLGQLRPPFSPIPVDHWRSPRVAVGTPYAGLGVGPSGYAAGAGAQVGVIAHPMVDAAYHGTVTPQQVLQQQQQQVTAAHQQAQQLPHQQVLHPSANTGGGADVALVLERIQTSLTALHERMNSIEHVQSVLAHRQVPVDPWTVLVGLFTGAHSSSTPQSDDDFGVYGQSMPQTTPGRYDSSPRHHVQRRRRPFSLVSRLMTRLMETIRRILVDTSFVLVMASLIVVVHAMIKQRGRGGRRALVRFWMMVGTRGRAVGRLLIGQDGKSE